MKEYIHIIVAKNDYSKNAQNRTKTAVEIGWDNVGRLHKIKQYI